LSSASLSAQVSDSTKTDSVLVKPENVEAKNDSVLSSQKKEVVIKKVSLWQNENKVFSNTITNDSLLRWSIYPNWGDFYAYQNNVISYRQGTIGRIDAFNINGYDQYEQELWLDEISLNNPITGLINYNYVPHHKIGLVRETHLNNLNSYVDIRDYYITEPISYLNFDEAPNDYRNLEFFVSQNTAPGTNIELSYWDRRDGGFYPDNSVEGSQIMGRIYHHLGDKYKIEGLILRNDFNKDESGGYIVNNPSTFSFGEFTSNPRSTSASSEILRNDIKAGIYQRADTSKPETGGLIFSRTKTENLVRINSDTLNWEYLTHRAYLFKKIDAGVFSVKADVSAEYSNRKSGLTIDRSNWAVFNGSILSELKLSEQLQIFGEGEFISRNTSHSGSSFSAGIQLGDRSELNLKLVGSSESKIPTIQSLYWQSTNYSGNNSLSNEKSQSMYGELTLPLGSFWEVGTTGRIQYKKNPVFLNSDSTFSNATSQDLLFSSGFVRFENSRFEIESSAVFEYTLDQKFDGNEVNFNTRDTKLWIRNSLFYKNYVFNRAAFLKMGVRTLLSPASYESQFYNTEANYWQANSLTSDQTQPAYVPAFFRLDAELSARVRAIMVVIRWENALDGFGQAGYFEASSFPMPPRRLIVGIRAQFRN
jgi:hypothetical protein